MWSETTKKVWMVPLLLAVTIFFGLLAALLGTAVWYLLSWIAMTTPLLVILIFFGKARRRPMRRI